MASSVIDSEIFGNLFGTGSIQLSFPLGLPKEFNVRGRLFADIGTLTEIDDEGPEILDEASPRASVGVGLTYVSPFGPILIDFGVPIPSSKNPLERPSTLTVAILW